MTSTSSMADAASGRTPVNRRLRRVWELVMSRPVELLMRVSLGSVFIYAGYGKLADVKGFAKVIGNYGLLPTEILLPFAAVLAAVELLAGLGLVFKVRGSLTILTGLILMFLVVLSYGMHIGLDADCGCFGPEDPEARWQSHLGEALARDVLFLAQAVYLYLRDWWQLRSAHNLSASNLEENK